MLAGFAAEPPEHAARELRLGTAPEPLRLCRRQLEDVREAQARAEAAAAQQLASGQAELSQSKAAAAQAAQQAAAERSQLQATLKQAQAELQVGSVLPHQAARQEAAYWLRCSIHAWRVGVGAVHGCHSSTQGSCAAWLAAEVEMGRQTESAARAAVQSSLEEAQQAQPDNGSANGDSGALDLQGELDILREALEVCRSAAVWSPSVLAAVRQSCRL